MPDLLKRWLAAGECLAQLEEDGSLGPMWLGDNVCFDKPEGECDCIMCDVRKLVTETKEALKS